MELVVETISVLYNQVFFIDYRLHGYEDDLATHSMLAAVVNTGYNLGGTLAPIVSGSVMQSYGFEFDPIIASILCFLMVSNQVVCFKF